MKRSEFGGLLKSCLPYLGSAECIDLKNEEKSNNKGEECNWSGSLMESKQILVRVVHAGGKVEHYRNAVLASKVLEKLPAGKWLARPEVFKHPHESIICAEEYLVPGQKYYVIPLSTMEKLKRKHKRIHTQQMISHSDVSSGVVMESEEEYSICMDDYSFCSAREFYASKEKRSKSSSCEIRNGANVGVSRSSRTRILLPLAKPKACSGYATAWEPGLSSIQELSP